MIDSIILKNMDTLKSVHLDKTSGSHYMLETNGISWGSAQAKHSKMTNYTGVGNIITNSTLDSRPIAITGRICPVHTTKQIATLFNTADPGKIAEYKLMEIDDGCAELSRIINPLSVLRILIGNFYIEGKPTSSLKVSEQWKENNEVYKKFTFSLECSDPMFYLKSKVNTALSGISGGFHFPLIITGSGMHFGVVQNYQLVIIENTSDVKTGGVLYFKATGSVDNPVITNVYTQESIKIQKSLVAGETIRIDTNRRSVEGSLDGENFTSYFDYWNWDNSWIEFPVGSTLLGFSADDETYKSLLVWVELQQSIYTLEDE